MKKIWFGLLAAGIAVFSYADSMPKGAIRNGTLGNQILVRDAMTVAVAQAATMGCDQVKDGRFFIEKEATGKPGKRTWKEIWQVQCNNGNYNVGMTFTQSPKGGVSYTASSRP